MQKFEVGGGVYCRSADKFFFPTNCDFLSAVSTSRVITTTILVFSRSFTFPIISVKEIRGLKFP